jgi:hypothetical protein
VKRRTPALAGVLLGVGVAAHPLVELWIACGRPDSETCVWYRALLPASLTASVVLGLAIAAIGLLVARVVGKGKELTHSARTTLHAEPRRTSAPGLAYLT